MVTPGPLKSPSIGNGHLLPPAEQKAPVPAGFLPPSPLLLWHWTVSFTALTQSYFLSFFFIRCLYSSHPSFFLPFNSPLQSTAVAGKVSSNQYHVQLSQVLLFVFLFCEQYIVQDLCKDLRCSAIKYCYFIKHRHLFHYFKLQCNKVLWSNSN